MERAWVRAMPLVPGRTGSDSRSAAYFTLRNRGATAVRLVGGSTPGAALVEVHETELVSDVMTMRRIDGVEVPPGDSVGLRPGGLHLMLLGLTRSLVEGETLDMVLFFEGTDSLHMELPILSAAPG